MRYGLIVAGQGQQHARTLRWLDDTEHTGLLHRHLGPDWRTRMADADGLQRNAVAQPLLTGLSLCAWQALAAHGLPAPAVVAGYSVGELAAFCVAGVFDADTAMELAQQRADAMDRASTGRETGLLGVSGLPDADIATLCDANGLEIAIRSGPGSVVLGGPRAALRRAASATQARGGHATALPIALASHTTWMRDAATAFAAQLRERAFHRPTTVLLGNHTGQRLTGADAARQALAHQVDHVVRWDEAMTAMAERGVRCVLEIGAGCALARQWNTRFAGIAARAADEFHGVAAVRDWVARHAAD